MRLALVNIQLLRHLTYLERPLKLGQIATSCRELARLGSSRELARLGSSLNRVAALSLAIGIARVRPLSDQHKYNYKRRTPTSALMQNKQYYIIYTHPNPRVYRRLGAPHYWWLGTTTLPYDVDDDDFWWPIKKIYNLSDARAPSQAHCHR